MATMSTTAYIRHVIAECMNNTYIDCRACWTHIAFDTYVTLTDAVLFILCQFDGDAGATWTCQWNLIRITGSPLKCSQCSRQECCKERKVKRLLSYHCEKDDFIFFSCVCVMGTSSLFSYEINVCFKHAILLKSTKSFESLFPIFTVERQQRLFFMAFLVFSNILIEY